MRVLALQPASAFDSTLSCSLIQHSRSDQLSRTETSRHYSAVSYTWGNQGSSCDLICTTRDPQRPGSSRLRITPNVDACLRHLRKAHKPIYLWVGAVSLNQKYGVKNGQQVPLMGDIYRGAKKVHIWLGKDESRAMEVFALIRHLTTNYVPTPSQIRLIVGLLERPWFHRRWIIQEFALIRYAILHWDSASLELSCLLSILPKLKEGYKSDDYGPGELRATEVYGSDLLLATAQLLVRSADFISMLWHFDQSDCGGPHNRIGALMGLAPALERFKFSYNTDDCQRVYRRIATLLINADCRYGHMIMLQLSKFGPVNPDRRNSTEWPSWDPDWCSRRKSSGIIYTDVEASGVEDIQHLAQRVSF